MIAFIRSLYHWAFGLLMASFWILLIGFVSLFVPTRRYHELWRYGFSCITRAFGLRMTARGHEGLDTSKGVIYMPHHVNSFEPFIAVQHIPHWVVAVEKQENFKIPIYSILIRNWGNIPIDRKDRTKALEQLNYAKQLLAQGTAVAIMPEGTRSRDGKLGSFKKGGFYLAIDTGYPIVPFVYKGLYDFNHHGSFHIHPRDVEVIFTPPIDTSGYTHETMPALMAQVRKQILDALGQTEDPVEAPEDAVLTVEKSATPGAAPEA